MAMWNVCFCCIWSHTPSKFSINLPLGKEKHILSIHKSGTCLIEGKSPHVHFIEHKPADSLKGGRVERSFTRIFCQFGPPDTWLHGLVRRECNKSQYSMKITLQQCYGAKRWKTKTVLFLKNVIKILESGKTSSHTRSLGISDHGGRKAAKWGKPTWTWFWIVSGKGLCSISRYANVLAAFVLNFVLGPSCWAMAKILVILFA